MTKYRIYEEPNNGTDGQDCGTFEFLDLPERIRLEITFDPKAKEWRLPSLSNGDEGEELDDLTTVVTVVD